MQFVSKLWPHKTNHTHAGDSHGRNRILKQESRVFNRPVGFMKNAAISGMHVYQALCDEAARDYEGFKVIMG
jgi:hypothetical protein